MKDFNDLSNPIGAVPGVNTSSGRNPDAYNPRVGDSITDAGKNIYSKFGHRGAFSDDNEAYKQFLQTENKQDAAALYELAIKWEIDKANLTVNQQLLEEQRHYDSPSERIKREKLAGINSDISGTGSSSGSSGSSAPLSIGEQDNTTSFGNHYADEELKLQKVNTVFNGINSIVNLASTVVGGFSSIVNSVSQLKSLPSIIRGTQAQADLDFAQANEINTLLSGAKNQQSLKNLGIGIDNASKVLSQFSSLREFLTADSDITPILTAMGVDSSQHDFYKSAFSELMKTPIVQTRDNRAYVSSAQSAEERALYTSDYFNRMISKGIQLDEMRLDFDILRQSIDNNIQEYLSNSDYSEDIANSLALDASNQAERNKLIAAKIERDSEVYFAKIDYLADITKKAKARQLELLHRTRNRSKSYEEQAELDSLEALIPMIEQLGSEDLDSIYSIERQIRRQAYLLDNNANYNPEKVCQLVLVVVLL